jgi:hypothetical protein
MLNINELNIDNIVVESANIAEQQIIEDLETSLSDDLDNINESVDFKDVVVEMFEELDEESCGSN